MTGGPTFVAFRGGRGDLALRRIEIRELWGVVDWLNDNDHGGGCTVGSISDLVGKAVLAVDVGIRVVADVSVGWTVRMALVVRWGAVTVRAATSGSLSFSSTLIGVGVSSKMVIESGSATGGSLTSVMVMVTSIVPSAPTGSLAITVK